MTPQPRAELSTINNGYDKLDQKNNKTFIARYSNAFADTKFEEGKERKKKKKKEDDLSLIHIFEPTRPP